MALSPNGKTVASGSEDGTVRLWDVRTGKVITKWKEHTQAVESVCWSPYGDRVVTGSFDGTARVWHVESGGPVQGLNPINTGHQHVYAVSYSPSATRIATCGRDGIKIWDAKTGKQLTAIKLHRPVWSLTWTSDEKKLISGSRNGSIRIFDTATWYQIAILDGHTQGIKSITLFRNDRLLASTSWDGTARLWNLDTNLQVGSPLQHERVQTSNTNVYVWDIQAIFNSARLEDLLFIPDVQKFELKRKVLSGAYITRRSTIRPASHQVPPGFFDGGQDCDPPLTSSRLYPDPSLHRCRSSFAPSRGPRALVARLPSLFSRSSPNNDEPTKPQHFPGPSTSSRRGPALDEKNELYVAWRPERAGEKGTRIKNPTFWARVGLFLCCASPSTDDDH
ncbi:quinon protein alcohol dehydrogenase-like superfamily [Suillus spraguei]|nr:quinon protein alcohol dehydrogenase-like superfamily [Suillus spraguei]